MNTTIKLFKAFALKNGFKEANEIAKGVVLVIDKDHPSNKHIDIYWRYKSYHSFKEIHEKLKTAGFKAYFEEIKKDYIY